MPDPQAVAALARVELSDLTDGQALKSLELILQLLECSPDPFARDQFTPGHITASGLVLAPDSVHLLLVHHRRLDRWLLPGGHVEPADDTIAGTDVHGIPAARGEPYHLHHDLLFAFHAASDKIFVSEESHAVVWCHPGEFDRHKIPANVQRAYRRIVGQR
jgi:hypothetical protein